ncbi:1-phosphofructokinase [Metasolibacillus sp.]|uniref:1-phosphofructokinase n=1 Tax=Metasolibacillus sp. TaxID=2703680 RepID=UPI0025F6A4A1|nr:1-phosphofructokinase [Metasolibacillus sp.]MCT6923869.1 1-phosphofructokinase [Metasolibacillus sp.]MCT6940407.1 1-phosphofructokinase [Metasolibacillus sp.]
MIYTMTLNPSIDFIVEVADFEIGILNKIQKEAKFPGGKGINVSQVLKRLGTDNKALGFVGGFTGDYIVDSLKQRGIVTDFVEVQEDTRINIKLKTGQETEINGQGPTIQEPELTALLNKIDALTANDVLVLAGSIPQSLPVTIYETLASIATKKGAKVVADTTGEVLLNVLPNKPFLIKPNHHELGELFDVKIETVEEAVPYGKRLVEMGAQHVIVSMAGAGALLFSEDVALYANVPKGVLKNSVGAGDSVVAGFLSNYFRTGDVQQAFKYGVASGSATAFSPELCTQQEVEELLPQIKLTTM